MRSIINLLLRNLQPFVLGVDHIGRLHRIFLILNRFVMIRRLLNWRILRIGMDIVEERHLVGCCNKVTSTQIVPCVVGVKFSSVLKKDMILLLDWLLHLLVEWPRRDEEKIYVLLLRQGGLVSLQKR